MRVSASIPRAPLTQNERERTHHMVRHRDNRNWSWWVLAQLGKRQSKRPPREPGTRARVAVTVQRRRVVDLDGLYASVKPLLDALTRHGWIEDDSPRWIDLTVEQRAGEEETVVVVDELND